LKLAIISDIHGNIHALEAVLASISEADCESVICLVDIVGYGARPNECIDRLISASIPCLLGNHDSAAVCPADRNDMSRNAFLAIEWTSQVLSEASKRFLLGLDLIRSSEEAFFVHSSPDQPKSWRYIFGQLDATHAFKAFDQSVCFFGHTHLPIVLSEEKSGRRLINVGSVGQPRDRDPRACYGVFETTTGAFHWERVAYDINLAAAEIIAAGLPPFLAERLEFGK